jgi:hypothetical protein
MRRFDSKTGPNQAVPALDDVLVITHPPRKLDRRTLEHFGPNGFEIYPVQVPFHDLTFLSGRRDAAARSG